LLALVFTAIAVAADQFAAPILYTSSPLWATAACLLLVWRRGDPPLVSGDTPMEFSLSLGRLAFFMAAHVALTLTAHWVSSAFLPVAGTVTAKGTLLAALKLSVLFPTIVLLPLAQWKKLARMYRAEGVAALIVLLTYFPGRAIETLWPWYGQALGRFVFALSRLFVPGVGYVGNLNPTLTGANLNVTIILACSGSNGLELFDYLFGLVAVLDWNRLQKRRALAGYFAGISAMLLGNSLRITSLVVLGNRGFAGIVSRYHISAGWIFFSFVFLIYLSMAYPWMLKKRPAAGREQRAGKAR
jgi:exosortase/archaeosortase family protein